MVSASAMNWLDIVVCVSCWGHSGACVRRSKRWNFGRCGWCLGEFMNLPSEWCRGGKCAGDALDYIEVFEGPVVVFIRTGVDI